MRLSRFILWTLIVLLFTPLLRSQTLVERSYVVRAETVTVDPTAGMTNICVIVYPDGRYRLERSFQDSRFIGSKPDERVYLDILPESSMKELQGALDGERFQAIQTGQPKSGIVQNMDTLTVSVPRERILQNISFVTAAGRKPFEKDLKAFVDWMKVVQKRKVKVVRDEPPNNCAAPEVRYRSVETFPGTLRSDLPVRAAAPPAPPQAPGHVEIAERHEFVIQAFKTEAGVTLPQARIVYGTYGRLNAARDNAVLLPSHYMADYHGYEWLIGPGRLFDPARDYLVATELFGNGHSSSPSNTPEPFHGPRFPVVTIRDNVEAEHSLLVNELRVTHLRAIVGFSMGAQQAFQWAVSYPDFADRIVATAGTAKTYPHGVVRLDGQIAALTADAAFNGGDYTTPPTKGLSAFAAVWAGWLYSQEWWRRDLWRGMPWADATLEKSIENFRARFISGGDANDLILQMRTWQRHDVGTTPGFGDVERALKSIRAAVLYLPSETDLYFPIGDARYEAAFIPHITLTPIPSLWGHTAGAASNPVDAKFLNDTIGQFLSGSGERR